MLQALVLIVVVALIVWLVAYMRAQKPLTGVQQLIQENRYEEAVAAATANDSPTHLHRGEALKLLGRFEEAIESYERSDDPAAREGIALSLAHLGRNFDRAKKLMEETIARYPQIQEFQALGLAYILLRGGEREAALRLYSDNVELLETRFRDDYTDPDPLLAETLWIHAALAEAAGEADRAAELRRKAAAWAPGSFFAA